MTSPETQPEKWWSIYTPYDIANRRDFIEKGDTERVNDIDTYIDYINNDMLSGYAIKTVLYRKDMYEMPESINANGTRVYLQNEAGEFELLGITAVGGEFFGQRIEVVDEEPILMRDRDLQGEFTRLGVSIKESAKIVPDKRNLENDHARRLFHQLRWINSSTPKPLV